MATVCLEPSFTLSLIGTVALFRNLLPPKDYYDREMAAAVEAIPTSVQDAVVRDVPVTVKHLPPADLEKYIPHPGMPRATRAVSKEKPEGSPTSPPNATVLQQHVLWFDFDGDGKIYPWDTFKGFRKLGFGYIISSLAAPFIHGSFSYVTQPPGQWLPNPLFPITIKYMHRTKHGSDSEVYDTEGRFVPEKFESLFSKFSSVPRKDGLTWRDIQEMVWSNANIMDPTGWIAERLEWWTTYLLLKDERGIITKEKIRGMYDGSIWEQIAAEVEAKRGMTAPAHAGQPSSNEEMKKFT